MPETELPPARSGRDPAQGRLAGRVAVVTGGSTGIGRAVAELFVRQGASVVVVARGADRLEAAVDELATIAPGRIHAVTGDVGDPETVDRAITAAGDRFGRLDILVSNAGIHRVRPVLATTLEEWDEVFRVNVRGAFIMCRAAARAMLRQGEGGAIVIVGSTNALVAEAHMAAYNASKAALTMLARSLAVDLAPAGIRVNVVAPGTIVSEITRPMLDAGFGFGAVPLGRIGDPIDVAWPVLWLASDEAAYVTGSTLVVDGGQIALNGEPPRSVDLPWDAAAQR